MNEKLYWFMALYLVEAVIAGLYFAYLFSRKSSSRAVFLSFFIVYGALFALSRWDNTTVNSAAFFIGNFLILRLHYQCGWKTGLFHTAILSFLMIVSEILVALIMTRFGYEFGAYTTHFQVMVLLIVFSKLLYLGLSVLASRIFSPHKHSCEDQRQMVLMCVLPILSVILATGIVYLGMLAGISGMAGILTVMIVGTLLLVNFVVLAFYNYWQDVNEENLCMQLRLQKDRADAAYYQALQEQYENQRILVHDVRRHLTVIDALAREIGALEIASYVSGIDSFRQDPDQSRLCTDPILNLILLQFREACKHQHVDFSWDVRQASLDFMEAADITALFDNLLSNALESAVQSEKKTIEFTVRQNAPRSALIVSSINSCDTPPRANGSSGFLTRKKDPIRHGVGLKSMDRVLRKYDGISTMDYQHGTRQFCHILQIPYPDNT